MLKSLVPALLVAGSMTSAMAEDQAQQPVIGFEFGANFNLFNDSRFEGNSTFFALVFPVGKTFNVAVYHEEGRIHGEEDGNDDNYDVDINQIRVGIDLWESPNGSQEVALNLGFGHASYTEDIDEDELVTDIAVRYTPIKAKNGPVVGALNVNAAYRYAPLNNVFPNNLNRNIDDLGGFVIGLGAGLYF